MKRAVSFATVIILLFSAIETPAFAQTSTSGRSDDRFFHYGVGALCGAGTALGLTRPTLSIPKKLLTAGGIGLFCGIGYYFLVSIGQYAGRFNLTDDQAKKAIAETFNLALASDVFGEGTVVQILKLPKEQQTPENIDRILGESAGLNPDACVVGRPNCA